MRLWHHELIPFLPKSQLLGQWRELNLIFSKKPNHILINYIYNYPLEHLFSYTALVALELLNRGYKVNIEKSANFFYKHLDQFHSLYDQIKSEEIFPQHHKEIFPQHHNADYLGICFFNLKEKYIRGQKDFDTQTFKKLYDFVVLGRR